MSTLYVALVSSALSVAAQFPLKAGTSSANVRAVLARRDVSKAYPLLGLGFVGTAVIGYLAGEQLSIARITGILLICAGVVLVGQS